MTALIAGIDLSSKRIDAALIPLDSDLELSECPKLTLRQFQLPQWRSGSTTPAFRTVERCRVIRDAMRELLAEIPGPPHPWVPLRPTTFPGHDVVHVCIETPLGSKSRSTVLWELYGAILASIPSHIERDTILTNEWRALVWPECRTPTEDWKARAIWTAKGYTGLDLDEHQAEALLIARACRARLDKAVAA